MSTAGLSRKRLQADAQLPVYSRRAGPRYAPHPICRQIVVRSGSSIFNITVPHHRQYPSSLFVYVDWLTYSPSYSGVDSGAVLLLEGIELHVPYLRDRPICLNGNQKAA